MQEMEQKEEGEEETRMNRETHKTKSRKGDVE